MANTPPIPSLPSGFSDPSLSAYTAVRSAIVIWNPNSGRKKSEWILATLKSIFEREGKGKVRLNEIKTEYAGHAQDIAHTVSLSGHDALIVIGGDGSIHEVINGLLTREDGKLIPIGIIPGGTGNSFMTDLGCQNDVEEAVRRVLRGRHHPVDAGLVMYGADAIAEAEKSDNGRPSLATHYTSWRWFFNIVHFGMSVDVNQRAEGLRALGSARYNVASLYEVIRGKYARKANIKIDGEVYNKFTDFCLVLLHNTINTGKNMKFAPRAKLDDGQFDLIVCDALSRTTLLKFFTKIFDGTHVGEKGVDYVNVKDTLVYDTPPSRRTTNDIIVNVDGENISEITPPVMIKLVKGAFRVFA